jgi:mevalonate pyrophosphate decarboxylase
MANGWTDERRARQAALIHSWKPWTHSTGATTPEGKAVSSRNAHRFTHRKAALLAHWLLQQTKALRDGKPFASDEECRRKFRECYVKDLIDL